MAPMITFVAIRVAIFVVLFALVAAFAPEPEERL